MEMKTETGRPTAPWATRATYRSMMPRFLQQAHPPQAGRGGKADLFGEVDVAEAAVGLQRGQDLAVDAVELHVRHNMPRISSWRCKDTKSDKIRSAFGMSCQGALA